MPGALQPCCVLLCYNAGMSETLNFQFNGPQPGEEETAAIAAAIAALLADEQHQGSLPVQRDGWRDSGKLVHQGLAPLKLRAAPTWHRVERLRRHIGGGFYGIVGL